MIVTAKSATTRTERTKRKRILDAVDAKGTPFVLAAATFFLGSAVLTQSGQPGASTPMPWVLSHASWVVATAFAAFGTVGLIRAVPELRAGIAGYLAGGLLGLGVLHALQWTAWVYVDVIAYQQGAHDRLLPSILHPFGTAHMLMFAVVLGGAVTALAWALERASLTRRSIRWTGGIVGAVAVLAGAVSLVTFAPTRSPTSLVAILFEALGFAWLFVLGVALSRGRPASERERSA